MEHILNVASFFSGCGGFDLGFKEAGYNIVLANDIWPIAAASYHKNFPETEFILKNIKNLTKQEIFETLRKRGLTKIDVVIGGPPCQCFTRLNNNNLKRDDQRNQLFKQYIRVVKLLNPDFVVMENVSDLLVRKNVKGQYFKDLILQAFKRAGYKVAYKVFEAEKYGVPQRRKRVIFIATNKKNMEITWPPENKLISTVGPFLNKLKEYKSLTNNQVTINEKATLTRIKHIPPGGYYENLPKHLKVKKVRNGKLVTVKRYGSYYRRLDNNQPSVTITANYFIHPDEDRYLTNREMATIHTFPHNFTFEGGLGAVSQQIANAVPPELAKRIGLQIKQWLN